MQTESNILTPVAEYDTNNEARSLALKERIGQKIAKVKWKEIVTTAIVVVCLFLLYASISLIGAFFPAEVRGDT